ncbi:MAG TPA: prepilin-type N-terminal cleavage/methylation domain-containing protein [Planctomycetota bacterium]|nr:prepilin-type N-terminal cleavage/methylation domain-containing protein [Planctomycetota bacterium]
MRHRAYTLIELLIAVALGMVIMLAAVAAVRTAAGALTMANRIGAENALICAGFLAALDEIDDWRTYDDATPGSANLRLRDRDAARGYGLPFTPMRDGWPRDAVDAWDGDAARWAVNHPDGRWRGNLAERIGTDLRFGRYAIFADVRTPAMVGSQAYGAYGPVQPRTWLASQVRGLDHALGHYGLLEYLPPNQVLAWYDAAPGADEPTLQGGMSAQWATMNFWSDIPSFDPYASRSILPPAAATDGWSTAQLVDGHRRLYQTGWMTSWMPGDMSEFLRRSLASRPLLPLAPSAWPAVAIQVCRSARLYRFNTLCRVRWTSPITGESSDLAFSGFGTTLRGARQARGLDLP